MAFQSISLLGDFQVQFNSTAPSPFRTSKDQVLLINLGVERKHLGRNLTETDKNQYIAWARPYDLEHENYPQWP